MRCAGCHQEHPNGSVCPTAGSVDLIGTPLRDYRLVRVLGRGASGVVYLAEHVATGLNVAIKLAPRSSPDVLAISRRLGREARFANQIALESVVNVFDFNDEDAVGPYIVMEYLEGESLQHLASQRLPADQAIGLLAQVADALAEAHDRNIVHGALQPSNVLRTVNDKRESIAKLLPFGVATGPRIDGEEPGDRDVAHLGSPDFRAPEQALGATADQRMDVYSLGTIAYLLATGRRPFLAPTPEALERAHAEVMPTAPHRVDVRVSRAWSAAILRAMEKSPGLRFQTAREFALALRTAVTAPGQVGSITVVIGGEAPLHPFQASMLTPAPFTEPRPPHEPSIAADVIVTQTPLPQPSSALSPQNAYAPLAPPRPESPAPVPAQGLVLRVVVSDEEGKPLGDFACNAVTRAGLIVITSGPMPKLLSRVKLSFADLSGLTCDAQVVHHVSPQQAAQWKMSPGYGVQFGSLSQDQRALFESAHPGLKRPETPSGLARRPDDPSAEEFLKRFTAERAVDAYAMLAISKGAPFDALRDRVRDTRRNLEALTERPLSLGQQAALEAARARLDSVGAMLCEPQTRLDYDASRGNFEGVARCINAGLSVAHLEAARIRFRQAHPGVEGKSYGSLLAAQTLAARQQMPQALEAYADALRIDPLNLNAQQRYWAMRRQLGK